MQNISRVNIFQTAEDLVNKILNMVDCKRLFAVNNTMQVCLHEILYKIAINIIKLKIKEIIRPEQYKHPQTLQQLVVVVLNPECELSVNE